MVPVDNKSQEKNNNNKNKNKMKQNLELGVAHSAKSLVYSGSL